MGGNEWMPGRLAAGYGLPMRGGERLHIRCLDLHNTQRHAAA